MIFQSQSVSARGFLVRVRGLASLFLAVVGLACAQCRERQRGPEEGGSLALTVTRTKVSEEDIAEIRREHARYSLRAKSRDMYPDPRTLSQEGHGTLGGTQTTPKSANVGDRDIMIVRRPDDSVVGTIRSARTIEWFYPVKRFYQAKPVYFSDKIPRGELETGHPKEFPSGSLLPPDSSAAADLLPCDVLEGSSSATIDILLIFSSRSADFVATKNRTIEEEAEAVAQDTNESFKRSFIPAIMRVARVVRVDVERQPSVRYSLQRLTDPADAWLGRMARDLRLTSRADLVVLVEDHGTSFSAKIEADVGNAFAVVSVKGLDTLAFTHEVGHLIGAQHALTQNRETSTFPYAAAGCSKEGTGCTLMATISDATTRKACWSSPSVPCGGEGVLGSAQENNRCVLLQRIDEISRFSDAL